MKSLSSTAVAFLPLAQSVSTKIETAGIVNLTQGQWEITGSDTANWNGSDLIFETQVKDGVDFDITGYFDWYSNGAYRGRELFSGTYTSSGFLNFSGFQLINPIRIQLSNYQAEVLSPSQIGNGTWGAFGISGTWTATNPTSNESDNCIDGTSNDDSLSGDRPSKSVDDCIDGLAGNDTLNGLTGDDKLVGGEGSDRLDGGVGNDELTGVGSSFGVGEIDPLTGGTGRDTFVLGNQSNTYYDDGVNGLSAKQVKAIMPLASMSTIEKYLKPLNDAMQEFGINTPARQAAFIAQVAVETGEFGARLPKKFRATEGMVEVIAPAVANKNYANRYGNGSEKSGDGYKYRGRGFLHITFKDAYRKIGKGLSLAQKLVKKPDDVAQKPVLAARTAGWYWKNFTGVDLSLFADKDEFLKIAKRVNGVNKKTDLPNGWNERKAYYRKAKTVIGQGLDNDYALITDFNPLEDKIQLIGTSADYLLNKVSNGVTLNYRGELITLIQGNVQDLVLSANYFQFG